MLAITHLEYANSRIISDVNIPQMKTAAHFIYVTIDSEIDVK